MSKVMHSVLHNFGDWALETKHMTRTERSIYFDMRELYLTTGKPLTADLPTLQWRLACYTDDEKAALDRLLTDKFRLCQKAHAFKHTGWDLVLKNYRYRGLSATCATDDATLSATETDRYKKVRQERKIMLNALKHKGITVDKNLPIGELRDIFAQYATDDATLSATCATSATGGATAIATSATLSATKNATCATQSATLDDECNRAQHQNGETLEALQNKGFALPSGLSVGENAARSATQSATCATKNATCATGGATECNAKIRAITNNQKPLTKTINQIDQDRSCAIAQNANRATTPKAKTPNIPFDAFWDLYDKKVDKPKAERLWGKLSDSDRTAIMEYIPRYVQAQPDKQFRKNPSTFLGNRSWENEIVSSNAIRGNQNAQNKPLTVRDVKNWLAYDAGNTQNASQTQEAKRIDWNAIKDQVAQRQELMHSQAIACGEYA